MRLSKPNAASVITSTDMTSIRARLNVYMVLVIAPVLAASSFGISAVVTGSMQREFDWALEVSAKSLAALTEMDLGEIEFEFDGALMPEFDRADAPHYFELLSSDVEVLFRSESFEFAPPGTGIRNPSRFLSRAAEPRFEDVVLPDGRNGRRVEISFPPRVDDENEKIGRETHPETRPQIAVRPNRRSPQLTLFVARERETLYRQFLAIYAAFVAVGVILLGAFAALVHVLLRAAFRPIDSLTEQVHSFEVEPRLSRIELPEMPREIAPVVNQLNALLGRVEVALARERQLTSNIGHELKTPIAELRNLCEVGGRWPDDPIAVKQFFADAQAISDQMNRIVSNLLLLARYEIGKEASIRRSIKIAEIMRSSWSLASATANRRGLRLVDQIPADLSLRTDPEILSLIFSNLLMNAASYARPDAEIGLSVLQQDSSVNRLHRQSNR